MNKRPSVVYVLPDKLGGIFSAVANQLAYRRPDSFKYQAVLTRNLIDPDTPAPERVMADSEVCFTYVSPPENIYAYLRRLRRTIPDGGGVLVCNDWVELAMVSAYPTGRTVINVSHADAEYYYELARIHEPWIDCFVAVTKTIHSRLLELLPHRAESIVYLPFGVGIPQAQRGSPAEHLRILFVGRLARDKGIFDLPEIDRSLAAEGCKVSWAIQGSGPDEAELRQRWQTASPVQWLGGRRIGEVLPLYLSHDVLLLPSRSEGLPVVLLEAGAAGMVPVVSDLKSGIPEVVQDGETGFRLPIGDVQQFANAIKRLAENRDLLASMSNAVRIRVAEKFEAGARARDYQDLFERWQELRRAGPAPSRLYYGSRLDKRWLPNSVVKLIRSYQGRLRPSAVGPQDFPASGY